MPAHAAVGVQSLLDEAGLPADARHQPVRLLVRPPPGGPPHLHRGTRTMLMGCYHITLAASLLSRGVLSSSSSIGTSKWHQKAKWRHLQQVQGRSIP